MSSSAQRTSFTSKCSPPAACPLHLQQRHLATFYHSKHHLQNNLHHARHFQLSNSPSPQPQPHNSDQTTHTSAQCRLSPTQVQPPQTQPHNLLTPSPASYRPVRNHPTNPTKRRRRRAPPQHRPQHLQDVPARAHQSSVQKVLQPGGRRRAKVVQFVPEVRG